MTSTDVTDVMKISQDILVYLYQWQSSSSPRCFHRQHSWNPWRRMCRSRHRAWSTDGNWRRTSCSTQPQQSFHESVHTISWGSLTYTTLNQSFKKQELCMSIFGTERTVIDRQVGFCKPSLTTGSLLLHQISGLHNIVFWKHKLNQCELNVCPVLKPDHK